MFDRVPSAPLKPDKIVYPYELLKSDASGKYGGNIFSCSIPYLLTLYFLHFYFLKCSVFQESLSRALWKVRKLLETLGKVFKNIQSKICGNSL